MQVYTEYLIIGTQYKPKLFKMHCIHYNITSRIYRNSCSIFRLDCKENIYIEGNVVTILDVAVA